MGCGSIHLGSRHAPARDRCGSTLVGRYAAEVQQLLARASGAEVGTSAMCSWPLGGRSREGENANAQDGKELSAFLTVLRAGARRHATFKLGTARMARWKGLRKSKFHDCNMIRVFLSDLISKINFLNFKLVRKPFVKALRVQKKKKKMAFLEVESY